MFTLAVGRLQQLNPSGPNANVIGSVTLSQDDHRVVGAGSRQSDVELLKSAGGRMSAEIRGCDRENCERQFSLRVLHFNSPDAAGSSRGLNFRPAQPRTVSAHNGGVSPIRERKSLNTWNVWSHPSDSNRRPADYESGKP
jgi:hypothetical protein